MNPEQIVEALKYIGLILTGGIGVAIIDWLSGRGINRSSKDLNVQEFWHKEFERLETRVGDQGKEIIAQGKEIDSLRSDIKGRDVTIKEITAENGRLNLEIEKLQANEKVKDGIIEKLQKRIKELEELMRKYGIDVNGIKEAPK
jgi:chromosome segregation ATPase